MEIEGSSGKSEGKSGISGKSEGISDGNSGNTEVLLLAIPGTVRCFSWRFFTGSSGTVGASTGSSGTAGTSTEVLLLVVRGGSVSTGGSGTAGTIGGSSAGNSGTVSVSTGSSFQLEVLPAGSSEQ